MRQALREASYITARGKGEVPLVYVDADEMLDALTSSGSYLIEGDGVRVTVRLIHNDRPIATVTAEGNKNDKEGLVKQIVQAITRLSSVEVGQEKVNEK